MVATQQIVADMFGYSSPEVGSLPNRDTLKWIQGLDLPVALRNPRRDVANGLLVAGILFRYFPEDVLLTAFPNGTSAKCKQENWRLLQKTAAKRDIFFEDEIVRKIMQGEAGAATALLEALHKQLSSRSVEHEALDEAKLGHAGSGIGLDRSLSPQAKLNRRGSVAIGISGLKEISKATASAMARQAAGTTKSGLALDLPDDMGGGGFLGPSTRSTPRSGRRNSMLGKGTLGQTQISDEDLDANPLGGLFPIKPPTAHEQGLSLGPVTLTPLKSLDEVIAWRRELDARSA